MRERPYPEIDVLLFLGSFDPPHYGHAAIARHATQLLRPRKTLFLLSGDRQRDKQLALAAHRETMLKIFTANLGSRYGICGLEAERELSGKTFETVTCFKREHPGVRLGLLMGSDNLECFHEWEESEALREMAHIFIVSRGESYPPSKLYKSGFNFLPPLKGLLSRRETSLGIKRLIADAEWDAIDKQTYPQVGWYVRSSKLYQDFFERLPHLRYAA